jgi:hypothetical protein
VECKRVLDFWLIASAFSLSRRLLPRPLRAYGSELAQVLPDSGSVGGPNRNETVWSAFVQLRGQLIA